MGSKTPLRYPGGKQRIWPFVHEIIKLNGLCGGHYVEPYAGGAGVAIELLMRGDVSDIHLNDKCPALYSFWHSVLNETTAFCKKVLKASLSIEEWKRQREIFKRCDRKNKLALGFATFYLNRCNRSGILTGGAIGGVAQQGKWKLDARFPRNELLNRIEAIAKRKRSIHLRNWDAERFIKQYIVKLPKKTLVYCDPPYFRKAERLYPNSYRLEDHIRIAEVIQRHVKHPWIVSYDAAPEILKCYEKRQYFIYKLQYNAGPVYKGTETFIFSDNLRRPHMSVMPCINKALEKLQNTKKVGQSIYA